VLTLGFTDDEILDLMSDVMTWDPEERKAFVYDVSRPGGVERVYQLFVQAGGTPDRIDFVMFVVEGAARLDMMGEAAAILQQLTNKDLDRVERIARTDLLWTYPEALHAMVRKIRRQRADRRRRIAVGASLGIATAGLITVLLWRPWEKRPFLWPT